MLENHRLVTGILKIQQRNPRQQEALSNTRNRNNQSLNGKKKSPKNTTRNFLSQYGETVHCLPSKKGTVCMTERVPDRIDRTQTFQVAKKVDFKVIPVSIFKDETFPPLDEDGDN